MTGPCDCSAKIGEAYALGVLAGIEAAKAHATVVAQTERLTRLLADSADEAAKIFRAPLRPDH